MPPSKSNDGSVATTLVDRDSPPPPETSGLVSTHVHAPGTAMLKDVQDSSQVLENTTTRRRPWHKTPSVWWLLPITIVSAMIRASTIAPRAELFIKFACDELRPEYRVDMVRWDDNRISTGTPRNESDRNTPYQVKLAYVSNGHEKGGELAKVALHRPDPRCAQDPAVHRAAAKLSAGITSAQGLFSVFTIGWWTQYSDRAGRTRLLGISALAVLITDALLFLVAFRAELVPGGYRILILGGAIDGLAGGFSATVAAGHAYVADCSSPLSRSRIFSFWTGVVYAGAAVGPSLGLLISQHSNDLLSAFYLCTGLHVVYGILMIFFVPESLSVEARAKARELYKADVGRQSRSVWGSLRQLTAFVRPLGVFVPKQLPRSRGWRVRDWNLALVGVAATAVAINTGAYHVKLQYALKTFHWNSVQLGYWISLVGFWRAVHLSVVLPLVIRALYARSKRLSGDAQSDDEKEAQVKQTDLLVVRGSLLADLLGYLFLGFVTHQNTFIGATVVLSFGGGFTPSAQSLALALAHPAAHTARREARTNGTSLPSTAKQEIGRLFGALALIQALGSQVVGPAMFSATFVATVGVYPRAIFWLSGMVALLALGALAMACLDGRAASEPSEDSPLLA